MRAPRTRGEGMDLQVARMKNFVGGEFVEAERGAWEHVIDPATGEVIAEVPRCAEEDVDRAVDAASRAFEGWFGTTPAERAGMLYRLADVLQEHAPRSWRGSSRGTWESRSPRHVESCRLWWTTCASSRGPAALWRARLRVSTCAGTLR